MKERTINVLKIFFMIFGIIFFVIIVISMIIAFVITNFMNNDFNIVGNASNKLKNIQPIINYAQDYYDKNGKYPEKLEGIKLKNDLNQYYKYEVSKDSNCYTVTTKSKNDNLTKQYQHCKIKTNNSLSNSESYIEFSN